MTVTRRRLAILLIAGAAWLFGEAATIHGKALLAQWLIARAWSGTFYATPARPWPWADTWPVGRLVVPSLGVDQYILHGTSGEALAFGPGLDPASTVTGESGLVLVAGHRDTHLAWLRAVVAGDRVLLTLPGGSTRTYEIARLRVIDSRDGPLRAQRAAGLVLVTCYPMDGVEPDPSLRYVVEADLVRSGMAIPAKGDLAGLGKTNDSGQDRG